MKKILLVDDDALMRRSLAYNLERAGFQTITAANAEDALTIVRNSPPDLVLLDIGLPEMDGLEAIKQIKLSEALPVIFVTARRRNLDEVLGLELGADDFITKPFDVDVLIAHIKAVLRRSSEVEPGHLDKIIHAGDLVMDSVGHTAFWADRQLDLSPREFSLLYQLAREPDRVVPTADLISRVWGAEFNGEPQVLYVHIRWLREKLERDPNHPNHILTIRGVGYKFAGGG
jgi:DNA-binding response OmpR family regulator